VAFVVSLIVLRLFRNRWAASTLNKISLALLLYAAIILGLGLFEIARRAVEGEFP
jgi:hypothetical protein